MKLTSEQLEAAAYIFEKELGIEHTGFEPDIIREAQLDDYSADMLEEIIIKGLDNRIYSDDDERSTAYWALGKRFKRTLIPQFRKWLKEETELNNPYTTYQILIVLDNLEEPVFNPDRGGSYAFFETELNLRDAEVYLMLFDE